MIIREEEQRFKNIHRKYIKKTNYGKVYEKTGKGKASDLEDKRVLKNPQESNITAFASGNALESLAKTNPEKFSRTKMAQLESSKNLVEDFNKFFFDELLTGVSQDSLEFQKNNTFDEKYMNNFYQEFNTTIAFQISRDIAYLAKSKQYSEDEIKKAIVDTYIPEIKTEAGCKELIKIRIKNNKLLTDSLRKMLKTNYQAFQISEAEAANLMKLLDRDDTNHAAIGAIRSYLKDPKLLAQFRRGNNYDFTSIGGGHMFLSNDDSIQFSQHPSKNMIRIFTYDAIVVGHGDNEEEWGRDENGKKVLKNASVSGVEARTKGLPEQQVRRAYAIIERYKQIVDTLNDPIMAGVVNGFNKLYEMRNEMDSQQSMLKVARMADKIADKCHSFITEEGPYMDLTDARNLKSIAVGMRKLSNYVKAIQDPAAANRDGGSVAWTVQPIDTLTKKGLTSVIEILRTLKAEGFKNIFVGACNPGHISLPKDLRDAKDFKVSYGTANVYLEEYLFDDEQYRMLDETEASLEEYLESVNSPYINYSLDALYEAYDVLEEQTDQVFTEGIGSAIKNFIVKAIEIVIAIWRKIIQFAKDVITTIIKFFRNRFGGKAKEKMEKPVDVVTITINNGKAKQNKKSADTPEDIFDEIGRSNKTINDSIKRLSETNKSWLERMKEKAAKIREDNDQQKMEEFFVFEDLGIVF